LQKKYSHKRDKKKLIIKLKLQLESSDDGGEQGRTNSLFQSNPSADLENEDEGEGHVENSSQRLVEDEYLSLAPSISRESDDI
jgi:hypothetical protein